MSIMRMLTACFLSLLFFQAQAAAVEEVLAIEEAFHPEITWHADVIEVEWRIAPGHSLYQDKFAFEVSPPAALGEIFFPEGVVTSDPFLGEMVLYSDDFQMSLPLINPTGQATTLSVTFQGCADRGFCYPPTTLSFSSLSMPPALASSEQAEATELLQTKTFWTVIGSFLLFGLLLSFTPCVLPMVPILSGILLGQKELNTKKAFFLSTIYVLSMASTYAILGIIAASLGQTLQSWVQNPWVLGSFASLITLMAFIIWEWIPLRLPSLPGLSACQSRIPSGTIFGVIALGFLATLVSSPCVTAPLIGALTYIMQTGDRLLGGFALFALGLGMGFPLIIFGAVGGRYLPKAGPWMHHVATVFGLLLLALALWLLLTAIPAFWFLSLAAFICLLISIRLGTFSRENTWAGRIGVLWIVLAALLGWNAYQGGGNINFLVYQEESHTDSVNNAALFFSPVATHAIVQDKLNNTTRPTLMIFSADWCMSCHKIEHQILNNTAIREKLANWQRLRVDLTTRNRDIDEIAAHYRVFAPPALLFFTPDGEEKQALRIVGSTNIEQFTGILEAISIKSP